MPTPEEIRKRVNRAWDDLEQLMQQLDAKQLKVLAPPATQAEIDELSKAVGLNLPVEIQASLLRHNGCLPDKVFLRYHFYSAQDIAKQTLLSRKEHAVWQDENPEMELPFEEGGWNSSLLDFGTSFAGFELVLELPDCETSIPNFFKKINYAMPLAKDFVSYLEAFAYHLREGNYINEFGTVEFDHCAETSHLK